MTSIDRSEVVRLGSTRTWRHGRVATLAALGGVTVAAWLAVVIQARQQSIGMTSSGMSGAMQSMSSAQPWTAAAFGGLLLMWAPMMVAMMLPSAVPMTLAYAGLARDAPTKARSFAPTTTFVAGYLAIWGLFAFAATVVHTVLESLSLLSPAMAFASRSLGAGMLIAAGVYELTPIKRALLSHCRAPAQCIAQHWHDGTDGAFRTGLALGAYCVGCCWVLMGLLFVGGVMNLAWIAAIAVFILFEKTVRFGVTGGRIAGVAMIVVGLVSLTGAIALN